PIPPTGIFDCRFQLPPNYDETKIDFRKDTSANIVWWLKFQPSSAGYPMTFTWNPNELPNTGFFYLKDGYTGTIVNVNMKNQNSYTLTNTGIGLLKIEYLFRGTLPVAVNTGWNILSIPLLAADMNVSSLFPSAVLPAYGYNNGYVVSNTLVNGKGYWVKFPSSGNFPITGIQAIPRSIIVNSGWNMIGPFDENIPVNRIISVPSGIVVSQYFGFNNGYVAADTLKPGKGYWVRTSGAGTLAKDTSMSMDNFAASDSIDNWTRVEITDNFNNFSNLYLANNNEIIESYDLPPIPPTGIFDVRFGSDKYVESFGQNHSIKINSASRPLTIRIYNSRGNKFILKDAINGSIVNKELTEGEDITIYENIDDFTLIEQGMLPKAYQLSQNYPNPFNPTTTIEFQIPKDGFTKMTLYNVLGKEVQTLFNKFTTAGTYKVNLNGSDLSSGLYFYKIESGVFTNIKRMILIK
ncbi:MAG: T9SS type A sorting domain-containing protein, partial [Ignavibacteria bacterium]